MSSAHPPALSLQVVVPVYNEEGLLERFLEELSKTLQTLSGASGIIFVDDGSTDGSWETIQRMSRERPFVQGLRFSRNFGKEAAIFAGLEAARADAVLIMDGDLQHPPSLIPDMVRLWSQNGYEVVEAWKERRQAESLKNRLFARAFYRFMRAFAGADLEGATDFKLLDRKVVKALLALPERNTFFRGLAHWIGFRRTRIFFVVPERPDKVGKFDFLRLVRLSLAGVTSFTSLPLHLTTVAGLLFLVFSLLVAGHVLYIKAAGQAISGFATIILLQLIVGSLTLLGNGIIGLYIAHLFTEVKKRPRYLVTEQADTPAPRTQAPDEA